MTFVLNFHGIGSAKRPYEEGEEPYWIDEAKFVDILDLAQSGQVPFAITFDDGNDSDYLIAMEELRRRGLPSAFFILAGKLDQVGYLSCDHVVQIDRDPLFTVGSHGMDHQPWPDISDQELIRETEESQKILSAICQRKIYDVGLPFGRYDRRTLQQLRSCDYRRIYSSDGGVRLSGANPVPRFSVRKDTDLHMLAEMMKTCESVMSRVKSEAKSVIKSWR